MLELMLLVALVIFVVLVTIAILMTVGVYGLVAGIVRLDDAGLYLCRHPGRMQRALGAAILRAAPWLMKFLSFAGTAAMFLVGGGILTHNVPALHFAIKAISPHGVLGNVFGMLADVVVGAIVGVVVLGVAVCFIYFGWLNFLRGFSSFRMPSMTPIASLYAAIPICGVLVALFTIEQLVNGLRNGFAHDEPPEPPHAAPIAGITSVPGS